MPVAARLQPTKGDWIAVDLDGVLAVYPHSFPNIGPPIPAMVERVRAWIREGVDVRIFTARVGVVPGLRSEHGTADQAFADDQRERIETWCAQHLDCVLPITAVKDFKMVQLWDDRCVQMLPNLGIPLGEDVARRCRALIRVAQPE